MKKIIKNRIGRLFLLAAILPIILGSNGCNREVADATAGLKSGDSTQQVEAAMNLGALGPGAAKAAPALADALNDKVSAVRRAAATALSHIGPAAVEAVPALLNTIGDENAGVRNWVVHALIKIQPDSQEIADALIPLVLSEEEGEDLKAAVCSYMKDHHPKHPDAVKALIEILNKPEALGFTMAIQAIGGYQADAVDAVSVLTNLLSDSSIFSQTHAARALGQIGALAAKALPELEKQLEDSEPSVKEEMQKAIDSIKSATGSEG
ncbi:MAG TPA: HEAT repeat domain-containing protein [Verrucomicrobiales bacterium]|nr:HEAT repeat domain-containing protein [Verrucomicrobiales bacterium]HIL69989.1 HEAT repeat domain-containing protein [Verrucomicrobiota bacterium]